MSMKRTKQRGAGGKEDKDAPVDFWAKPQPAEKTFAEDVEGKDDSAFTAYTMAARYTKGQLVTHPKFGKGIVTDVEPSRVEILFGDGKKKLGHGQAS
jgi:hypothetical protein